MQINQVPKIFAVENNSVNQTNAIEEQPVRGQLNGIKPDFSFVYDGAIFLIPMGFIAVWTIFVLMSSDIWTVARHGVLTVKNSHQVPCRNCQFFKNNPYLQCAVHPATALTADAANCSDYCPANKRF
ncbi:MAG TPA: hypothetical protein V6D50_21040 [Chroococcales cyanobacterium]|jgi:hypothetical protein